MSPPVAGVKNHICENNFHIRYFKRDDAISQVISKPKNQNRDNFAYGRPNNIAESFSKEELTDILLYHVLTQSVSSAEAKVLLGNMTTANGKLAGLKNYDDSLWVNDDSRVILENAVADNGTIHVVDNVILGPWPRD